MGLFIVRHKHQENRCPANDPDMGAMLLSYLSRPNVRQHGVEIQGEVVVQGEHILYMIIEADGEDRVRRVLEPFAEAGTVEVHPASTCARVVASGGCVATMPPVDDLVPAVDPEEACQNAIDTGLVVHRAHPLNCETSIPALIGGVVMPNAHFYVRNHFQIPMLDPATWRLDVGGLVEPVASEPSGSAQHAFPELGRHVGVRWQQPVLDGSSRSRRAVAPRCSEHGRVDEPATLQRVRALITEPSPDEEVELGDVAIRGVAWSGAAAIARVEVSVDGGAWREGRLVGERHRHSWQWWELITHLDRPGSVSLRVRATDLAGRTQPDRPEWNRLGYGNNAIQEVRVSCRRR